MKKMQEQIENEVRNASSVLGISVEEAEQKYSEICADNGAELYSKITLSLWRSYVMQVVRSKKSGKTTQQRSNNLVSQAFGFFISLEEPRDVLNWSRKQAKEAYLNDALSAVMNTKVAEAVEREDGQWSITRSIDGENTNTIVRDSLPEGAETLEDGRTIIPLYDNATYMNGAKNANYGKPMPKEELRRTGVFFGSINGEQMKPYAFSYKRKFCVEFNPQTFDWVHFVCIRNEDNERLFGFTEKTLGSLRINSELEGSDNYRDVSELDPFALTATFFSDKIVSLGSLDTEHIQRLAQPSNERYIITDGTVSQMVMTPTANGNRILTLTDLDVEIDYESGQELTTTCWIPPSMNLDFGIGSTVTVVGRTSKRSSEDGDEPVTINVSGLYVNERLGSPVAPQTEVSEDSFDWF